MKVPVSAEKQARLEAQGVKAGPVTLGIRPTHMMLADGGVKGTVDVSEMMGSEVHLHLNTLGRDAIVIVPTTDLGGKRYTMGDEVTFTFSGDLVHLFDPETGKNLEY